MKITDFKTGSKYISQSPAPTTFKAYSYNKVVDYIASHSMNPSLPFIYANIGFPTVEIPINKGDILTVEYISDLVDANGYRKIIVGFTNGACIFDGGLGKNNNDIPIYSEYKETPTTNTNNTTDAKKDEAPTTPATAVKPKTMRNVLIGGAIIISILGLLKFAKVI